MSPVVYTFRFQLVQAFEAWTRDGDPTDEKPILRLAQWRYPPDSEVWQHRFYVVGADGVWRDAPWDAAIRSSFDTPADFDQAARWWALARKG